MAWASAKVGQPVEKLLAAFTSYGMDVAKMGQSDEMLFAADMAWALAKVGQSNASYLRHLHGMVVCECEPVG